MLTRAIVVAFHKYTPFGLQYYDPMLDFFLTQMKKYKDEWDKIYLVDSTWNIGWTPEMKELGIEVIKVNSNLRYYDAYKEVLPQVTEDLVLFMDNDFIVYKHRVIQEAFNQLEIDVLDGKEVRKNDVVSITDTIGTMQVPLKTGNKLCPYFFATRKDLLIKYLDVDWSGDNMPYTETFGLLTEAMLKDGCKVCEMEDDKGGVTFDGDKVISEKDLGYYHVRAGTTIAYLLATKHYGDIKTYQDYLKNQPHQEIIRHCCWYAFMGGDPKEVLEDLNA